VPESGHGEQRSGEDMTTFLLRCSCEYAVAIEAETEEDAIALANKLHPDDWDSTSWSEIEIDKEDP
jgi:hypothetical protein